MIMGASITSALATFIIQLVVGRAMPVEVTKDFLVFWSLVFGVFGIVAGVINETTRAVGKADLENLSTTPILPVVAGMGVIAALIFWALTPIIVPRLDGRIPFVLIVLIGIATIFYACHCAMAGIFAGHSAWGRYSLLSAAEALVRLGAVVVAIMALGHLICLEIAILIPVLLWIGFAFLSYRGRFSLYAYADVKAKRLVGNYVNAMIASASSAILITGFPTFIEIFNRDESAATLASLIYVISFTRSPIMMPLQAFQGVAINRFLTAGARAHHLIVRFLAILIAFGAICALAAYFLGDPVMRLLFAGKYHLPPIYYALLMVASIGLAAMTLTGTAILALNRHGIYCAGWIIASVSAVGILALPAPIVMTAVGGLIAGPIIGVVIHMAGIRSACRKSALLNES